MKIEKKTNEQTDNVCKWFESFQLALIIIISFYE